MKRHITVGAIQMEIIPLDIGTNLKKAEYLLEKIYRAGNCDLVIFPEDFITGPIPNNLDYAMNIDSQPVEYFQKLARKYKIHIVAGSFIEKVQKDYFNTSILIDPHEKNLLTYRKNYLWHPEKKYLKKGTDIKVAKTKIGTIGIIICWDIAFPSLCNKLASMNVDIICCPSYWTKADGKSLQKKYGRYTEETMVNALCRSRAIENEAIFIFANGAGSAKFHLKTTKFSSTFIGQSQICVPILGQVKSLDHNKEGFIIYKYDRCLLKDAKKTYNIRKDLTD